MLHPRTRIDGDIAYLTLTKGYTALIDAADAARFGKVPWYAHDCGGHVYATRTFNQPEERPQAVSRRLHRMILDAPDDMLVDHINGHTLDNRRVNLRIATASQNTINQKVRRSEGRAFPVLRGPTLTNGAGDGPPPSAFAERSGT